MDAIVAISTAQANGGIGIIRMSGKDCFKILEKIFKMKNNIKIEDIPGYTIKYGHIINSTTNEIIDEVLVSFFKEGKSYTKENMCEINSHGGIIVEKMILQECLKNGAIMAEPGEFTKRAFLNGRIDLTQAESIIDIINSKSEKETKAALNQLEGGLADKIKNIKKDILNVISDIDATIDYPEYDIENVTNNAILNQLNNVLDKTNKLISSYDNGKLLKEGIKTAIVGKPNAGKSSLLNLILNEERAIVSDIEGTTRDTIEEYVNINGICLKLIDTAGIRETTNKIEEIGVEKALKSIDEADLVIAVFDTNKKLDKDDYELINKIKDKNKIIVLNKIDLENKIDYDFSSYNTVMMSAINNTGLDELFNTINNMYSNNEIESDNSTIVTNIRHKNEIEQCSKNIKQAIEGIKQNIELDLVAIHINNAIINLNNITGENITDDILNTIFSKFCLGK